MTFIESVFSDLYGEMPIVSLELMKWELEIGCHSVHTIQHLHKSVFILTQDHPWDNGNFITLISANQLEVPTFKEGWLSIKAVIYAGVECGMYRHCRLSYLITVQ
jgi:hypothetical protein